MARSQDLKWKRVPGGREAVERQEHGSKRKRTKQVVTVTHFVPDQPREMLEAELPAPTTEEPDGFATDPLEPT